MNRADWVALPLRLMIGVAFIYHGFPKLFTVAGNRGFIEALQGTGVPVPVLVAIVVGIVEFFGGIALLSGALTRIVSAILIVEMLVAMFMVHLSNGFSFINIIGSGPQGPIYGAPGVEVNLLYIAGLLTVILNGAGALSIDRLAHDRRKGAGPSK